MSSAINLSSRYFVCVKVCRRVRSAFSIYVSAMTRYSVFRDFLCCYSYINHHNLFFLSQCHRECILVGMFSFYEMRHSVSEKPKARINMKSEAMYL